MAKIKKKKIATPNTGENVEKMDHSHSAVENGTINLGNSLAIS